MHFLDTLNPEQREAVLHTDGPLLILAGAGSGKTRVIAHRIAYLVGDGHAEPDEVLAVTFTNKAAEEMRDARRGAARRRLPRDVDLDVPRAVRAAAAPRGAAIGLSRDFVIYDSSDQLTVVKQALKELQHRRQRSSSRGGAVADQPREEPDGRPGDASTATAGIRATSRSRKIYALLPEGAEGARARSTSTICC